MLTSRKIINRIEMQKKLVDQKTLPLPKDILFSSLLFLSVKELDNCSRVSKNWQNLSKGVIATFDMEICYLIGKFIIISKSNGYGMEARHDISYNDILDSFPKNGVATLFKTSESVVTQIHSDEIHNGGKVNILGKGEELIRCAVFKVKAFSKISKESQKKNWETQNSDINNIKPLAATFGWGIFNPIYFTVNCNPIEHKKNESKFQASYGYPRLTETFADTLDEELKRKNF